MDGKRIVQAQELQARRRGQADGDQARPGDRLAHLEVGRERLGQPAGLMLEEGEADGMGELVIDHPAVALRREHQPGLKGGVDVGPGEGLDVIGQVGAQLLVAAKDDGEDALGLAGAVHAARHDLPSLLELLQDLVGPLAGGVGPEDEVLGLQLDPPRTALARQGQRHLARRTSRCQREGHEPRCDPHHGCPQGHRPRAYPRRKALSR